MIQYSKGKLNCNNNANSAFQPIIKASKLRTENESLKDENFNLKQKNEILEKFFKKHKNNLTLENLYDIEIKNDEISKIKDFLLNLINSMSEFLEKYNEEIEFREKNLKTRKIEEKFKICFDKILNYLEVFTILISLV